MVRGHGITIRDVARRAGVSITAVSHALNGKGTIAEATRERIVRVATEMGYQADAMARGLRSSSIGAIGVVFRSLDALGDYQPSGVDVFMRFVGEVSGQALARGLSVVLVPDLTRKPIQPLAFSLDGYIVSNPHRDDPVVALLEARGIPVVSQGRVPGRDDFAHWSSEDDRGSMRRLLDHLARGGARSIALVHGTDPNAWNLDSMDAYEAWCAERGAPVRMTAQPERTGVEGGAEAARRLLAEGLPDAVVCMTGRHAAGLEQELAAAGVHAPADVLIATGSDSLHARTARPAITAIEMNPRDTAGALLDELQALIAGGDAGGFGGAAGPSGRPRLTATRLRVRGSTSR